jgi:hypothetical protein
MTKEMFLAGITFDHCPLSKASARFKYIPSTGVMGHIEENGQYYCSVKYIDRNGFSVARMLFDRTVRARIEFRFCVATIDPHLKRGFKVNYRCLETIALRVLSCTPDTAFPLVEKARERYQNEIEAIKIIIKNSMDKTNLPTGKGDYMVLDGDNMAILEFFESPQRAEILERYKSSGDWSYCRVDHAGDIVLFKEFVSEK